ncbi:response regulator transcription factor [Nanchangia anserum]|uniref:DNA-binding response regulator MtrA n=1 Tax=Nanchangia anserum TaxID=2692125 RepID=A0A8I0GFV8_9ACTO|nr:MtrAB system response regulator MtrA [Nanchangia anserum]MBD3690072.1 response regulator transcription factor [Nanchangia anserum]QOX82136.1 response regulator transcription factor [Nanchangia anserum]
MTRILVVDDDQPLAEMIGIVLESEGYDPVYCHDGAQALSTFRAHKPDLILLDLMLPGLGGIEICQMIRAESDVPIVMLTAKSDTADVVAGLEAGADDYIPKPFKPKELIARIRVRLRGHERREDDEIILGPLHIDVRAHEVRRSGDLVRLTPLEFDLLVTLASDPHKAFARDELLEKIWGYRHGSDARLVNVHVQRLRAKIEADPEHPQIVQTVRGVGYRACAPDQ